MLVGLVTGIGVGVFRVHPLIMTLGMSLVVLGLTNVWQIQMVQSVARASRRSCAGWDRRLFPEIVPYSLVVFVPVAAVILVGLRRTGYGRLLYAIGDNPIAARLSGARSWQVLIVLYVISAVLAAIAGFLISGLTNVASVTLGDSYVLPSVAAAVIGGTSIMGGRGGFGGDDRRRVDPDRPHVAARVARVPRGRPPGPVRGDHRRRGGGLHPGDRRDLMDASGAAGSRHLGLDLGGTNIKWAVVEHDGRAWLAVDQDQVPTPTAGGPDAVVARLAEVATEAIRRVPGVSSVGIGVPGLYDPVAGTTRFLVNIPGPWAGRPVAGPVGEAVGLPAFLINDARAFGLAELRLGAGRGASSMVGLTLGTGVGGVVAINGHVLQGHDGTAGELGHQTIDPDGPWCGCGNRGCLEAFARADQIAAACGTRQPRKRSTAPERAIPGDRRASPRSAATSGSASPT